MSPRFRRVLAHCVLIAGAGLLHGCAEFVERADDETALPKQLRTRQIVVTLAKADSRDAEAIAISIASRYRLQRTGTFPLESIGVECVVFDVPPNRRIEDVITELRRDAQVESAQPNGVFDGAQSLHNDPYAELEYGATSIHADRAHRISTGKGVLVALVDTGVDLEHPDLKGRIAKVANFVDGGESSFATDRHGTAVAGVIGARADNAVGIFGVAPDAELLVAKACWYGERSDAKARCSSWTLAKAIDYAIREHSQVLNLSLKGRDDSLLARLLTEADARGIVVVAAAAEEGMGPGFPAAMPSVIAVIASDSHGDIKAQRWLDDTFAIAAPGVDILTTMPHASYDFVSGSSISAAEVSGVVALLLEGRPALTPHEIRELLRRSAHPVIASSGRPAHAASGVVDACGALSELLGAGTCR